MTNRPLLQELFAEALHHHQDGRLNEAEQLYRQILTIDGDHADSLHLMGVLAHQAGRHEAAIALIERAVAVSGVNAALSNNPGGVNAALSNNPGGVNAALSNNPGGGTNAAFYNNLGEAYRASGRLAEAAGQYRQALALRPDYAEACNNLGAVVGEQGRLEEAEAHYRRALAIRPDFAEACCNLGIVLRALGRALGDLGRLDEARAWLERAVATKPDYVRAHNALGVVARDQGRAEEALAHYRRAIEIRPDFAEAYTNLGLLFQDRGRPDDAAVLHRHVLSLRPDDADAHFNLGNAFKDQGRLDDAVARYRRALELRPDHAEAHNNLGAALRNLAALDGAVAAADGTAPSAGSPEFAKAHYQVGNVLKDRGRLEAAAAHYRRALALKPDFAEACNNLGNILKDQGRLDEAEAQYRQALAIRPDSAVACNNLGAVCQELGRLGEAEEQYRRALVIKPDYAEAHYNLGLVLQDQGDQEAAEAQYRRALAIKPDYAKAHNNLGNALKEQGRLDEAVTHYRRSLDIRPGYAKAHNNLGNVYKDQGRLDEAMAHYRQALALQPDYAEAHWNEALLRLLQGDFAAGWREYEWRWRKKDTKPHGLTVPLWDGSDLGGRTILLHSEQGLGDTLQFVRYAPMVRQRGGRVVLSCPSSLAGLFQDLAGVDGLHPDGRTLPAYDCHAPLMSLPGLFGTDLGTIPAAVPYLRPDPVRVAAWRDRLAGCRGLKVGVAWRGNPQHKNDRNRSMTPAAFAGALRVEGLTVVSLQKDASAQEIKALGVRGRFLTVGSELKDFSDTAAVTANLDLVITVDTSICHLAGALAVPVWTLVPFSPDWRWLLARDDNPWYPTLRLFRQPKIGDWASVVGTVAAELSRFSGGWLSGVRADCVPRHGTRRVRPRRR